MKRLRPWLPALALMLAPVLCDCSDDDYHYPDAVTELGEITVSDAALATLLTTDTGATFDISSLSITSNVEDTILRCLCRYALSDDGSPTFYTLSTAEVFCTMPAQYETQPTDPLDVISAWSSGRYLNLYVATLTNSDITHALGFQIDSISDDGVAYHTLLHQASDTAQYYTSKHYLSLPLWPYTGLCDSVRLTVHTSDGLRSFAAAVPQ